MGFQCIDKNGKLKVLSTGTGIACGTGHFAARPNAGNQGNLYLPDDSIMVSEDSGSLWNSYGPIYPFTEPIDANYSWQNQNTGATVDLTHGGIYLQQTATGAGTLSARMKTAPATPYTVTLAMLPFLPMINFATAGCGWMDTVSGKAVLMNYSYNSGLAYALQKFTTLSSFSAAYSFTIDPKVYLGNVITNAFPPNLLWVRLADDGTNRKTSISLDGTHWIQVHSVSRTDFLTPNAVGFAVQTDSSETQVSANWLLSWKETSP